MYHSYYTRFGTPRAKFLANRADQYDCESETTNPDPAVRIIAEARAALAANYWARECGMLAGVERFEA